MLAPFMLIRKKAKARPECSPETLERTIPSEAGAKNACPVPPSAASTAICHSRASPVSTSSAKRPCETQLSAFAATITRWRGSRSATAPPISRKTTSGTVRAVATRPTSVAEPPVPSTANAAAISEPALPRLATTAADVSRV
ncbi:hypothetical protein SRIMM317S_04198 [Streptomyces rimosus subsp. rimosus]